MIHILRNIASKCVVHITNCDVLGSWKIYFTTRIIEKKVFAYKGYHDYQKDMGQSHFELFSHLLSSKL